MKAPKIKPNYKSKAGGMFMKRMSVKEDAPSMPFTPRTNISKLKKVIPSCKPESKLVSIKEQDSLKKSSDKNKSGQSKLRSKSSDEKK